MAAQGRTADHPLIEDLLRRARDYSFFQLVALLERLYQPKARVGGTGPATDEVLRLRPDLSFAFPSWDIAGIEKLNDDPPRFRLTTTFLGLYGTTSPLPPFYTEDLLCRDENDTVRSFLDIFHHRLLSLFYRCWAKYRYHVQFLPSAKDAFSQRMLAFLGLGTAGIADQTGLSTSHLLRYAGLFNQQPRSASALGGVLSDFFDGIEVHIEQCTGQWVSIPDEQRASLGRMNCTLGQDISLGARIFSRQSNFRISLRSLDHETFLRLVPGGSSARVLYALVRLFVQDRFDFDLELCLRADEVPSLRLASEAGDGPLGRLGLTSWFPSQAGDGRWRSVVFQFDPAQMTSGAC